MVAKTNFSVVDSFFFSVWRSNALQFYPFTFIFNLVKLGNFLLVNLR